MNHGYNFRDKVFVQFDSSQVATRSTKRAFVAQSAGFVRNRKVFKILSRPLTRRLRPRCTRKSPARPESPRSRKTLQASPVQPRSLSVCRRLLNRVPLPPELPATSVFCRKPWDRAKATRRSRRSGSSTSFPGGVTSSRQEAQVYKLTIAQLLGNCVLQPVIDTFH